MKKLIVTTLTILTLILTACGASSNTPQASPANQERTLPLATQLIVGTFKLDDTEQAVTTEQAKELLPLWQVYQDLGTSDTAAQEEIEALVEQIQETMTAEQVQAITDMNLTQQDVMSVMQDQGMNISQRSNMGNGDGTTTGPGGGFTPPDGGFPAGDGGFTPPDGGFQGGPDGGGQNLTPEQIATAQAARQQGGGGGGTFMPTALLDALIKLLQEKAGS